MRHRKNVRFPKFLLVLMSIGLGAVSLPGEQAPSPSSSDTLVSVFKAVEPLSVNINQWKQNTNDNGFLAWHTSWVLAAYMSMYQVTHDRDLLNKFMALADPLLGEVDAQRGVTDYKGRGRVGWSSTAYSGKTNARVVYLVHSANLTYPMAEFAYAVKHSHGLGDLASHARDYQSMAEAAINEFNGDWRYDAAKNEGYYVYGKGNPSEEPSLAETPLPFNMDLAAGMVLIELWKLTGNNSYREKARALAQYFKDNLRVDASGAYVWNYGMVGYGQEKQATPPAPEDFSHGATDVCFAVLAAQNSIVFTRSDLDRFAKAYFRYAANMKKPTDRDVLDLWVCLSWQSCAVYQAIYPDLISRRGRQAPTVLLALGEAAKYVGTCH